MPASKLEHRWLRMAGYPLYLSLGQVRWEAVICGVCSHGRCVWHVRLLKVEHSSVFQSIPSSYVTWSHCCLSFISNLSPDLLLDNHFNVAWCKLVPLTTIFSILRCSRSAVRLPRLTQTNKENFTASSGDRHRSHKSDLCLIQDRSTDLCLLSNETDQVNQIHVTLRGSSRHKPCNKQICLRVWRRYIWPTFPSCAGHSSYIHSYWNIFRSSLSTEPKWLESNQPWFLPTYCCCLAQQ